MTSEDQFYEDDQPIDEVLAAFERGHKATTVSHAGATVLHATQFEDCDAGLAVGGGHHIEVTKLTTYQVGLVTPQS